MGTVILGYALSKGVGLAIDQGKKAAKNKLISIAKEKTGKVFFGNKLAEMGDPDGTNRDFRGLQMYKAPKPAKIVRFFCGGDVIDTHKLNTQLLNQAKQSYDFLRRDSLPSVERDEDGKEIVRNQAPAEDQNNDWVMLDEDNAKAAEKEFAEKDAKPAKPVNKPITIDDFKSMVTIEGENEKKAKNKGYVRFVKCDDGKGVKLDKVGNKLNIFMSWRVNVTKEHNRQMRLLFAETMLNDFGGISGTMNDDDNSVYGSILQQKLSEIRTSILNRESPGEMLKRTTVRECIEMYNNIFEKTSLEEIAKNFIDECLKQCQYTRNGRDGIASVDEFLKEYGKYAPEGMRSYKDLKEMVTNIKEKNGLELKAGLAKIAYAFGKMNEYWQQDKVARNYLNEIAQNPTSTATVIVDEKHLSKLSGAILRRMEPEGNAKPNNAELVSVFFDKAFPVLVDSFRKDFQHDRDANKLSLDDLAQKFRERLSLESILNEVEKFGKVLREKIAEGKKLSPMGVVIQHKENEKAGLLKLLQDYMSNNHGAKDETTEKFEHEIANIDIELKWLNEQEAAFQKGEITLSEDFQKEMENKALDDKADEEMKRSWSKDGLMSVLIDGAKSLDENFQRDYIIQTYLKERCPNIAENIGADVQKIMQDIVQKFENIAKVALVANVRDKGDIAMQDLITEFADFLMYDVNLNGLKNEETIQTSRNPYLTVMNSRRTSPTLFIEGMMRVAIKSAMDKKVASGDKFYEQIENLKNQTEVLAKSLTDLFKNVKKGKLAGFTSYIDAVQKFSYKSIVSKDKVDALKEKYLSGARHLIYIKLVQPFIEEDIPELLAETNVQKFTAAAQNRLDLRVEESMSAFKASNMEQFYTGTLKFKTSIQDKEELVPSLFGLNTIDEDTKYTNPIEVAQTFVNSLNKFKVREHLNNPDLNRPEFRPLKDDDLAGFVNRYAENVWRENVVTHAPGSHRFLIIDTIISKFQDFLNVSADDRRADITNDWLNNRTEQFNKKMNAFVSRYATFEKRLVKACQDKVSKALLDGNDSRFASIKDPAMRERLVKDILGSFIGEIGDALRRFIENPDAFYNTDIEKHGIFGGNDTRLDDFVNDILGVTLRGDNADIRNTKGFKKMAQALEDTIKTRQNFVKDRLESMNDGIFREITQNIGLKEVGPELSKFKGCMNSSTPAVRNAAYKACRWAADRAEEFARNNPLEAYVDDPSAFYKNLVDRAYSSLVAVSDDLSDQIRQLDTDLTASRNEAEDRAQNNMALLTFDNEEHIRVLESFAISYCDLAQTQKNKSKFESQLKDLVAETLSRYEANVAIAEKHSGEIWFDFYKNASPVFNAMMLEGEEKLIAHGATGDALNRFVQAAGKIWSGLADKLNKSLVDINAGDYDQKEILAKICKGLEDDVSKLLSDYTATLDKVSLNFTKEGIEKLLEIRGINHSTHEDIEVFNSVVQALLNDQDFSDVFASMQCVVLDNMNQTFAPGEFSFVQNQLDPVFRLHYQLKAAQKRLDAQTTAVSERITAMAGERNVPKDVLDGILKSVNKKINVTKEKLNVRTGIMEIRENLSNIDPDTVNLDIDSLVADAAKAIDAHFADKQLDADREDWLKVNLDKIAARVYNAFLAGMDNKRPAGEYAKENAKQQRTDIPELVKGYLISNVLDSKGKAAWDTAMADILRKDSAEAITEQECNQISPALFQYLDGAISLYNEALDQDDAAHAAKKAVNDEINKLSAELNKSLLTMLMPSKRSKGKEDDYQKLISKHPEYAYPSIILGNYFPKYEDSKNKKDFPAPTDVEAFLKVVTETSSDCLRTLSDELTKQAKIVKSNGKWGFKPFEKTTEAMTSELLAAVMKQTEVQNTDPRVFTGMLKFMLSAK